MRTPKEFSNTFTYEDIMALVEKGILKKAHTVKYSYYVYKGETVIEKYDGRYGKGFKVYTHMVGGSNLGRFSKCWLTYYLYT